MRRKLTLSFPAFGFMVGTRAALGLGIGLLAADKLRRWQRRRIGMALVGLGALTTIPAAFILRAGGREYREAAA